MLCTGVAAAAPSYYFLFIFYRVVITSLFQSINVQEDWWVDMGMKRILDLSFMYKSSENCRKLTAKKEQTWSQGQDHLQ